MKTYLHDMCTPFRTLEMYECQPHGFRDGWTGLDGWVSALVDRRLLIAICHPSHVWGNKELTDSRKT